MKRYKFIRDNPEPDSVALIGEIGEIDWPCCSKIPVGNINIFISGSGEPLNRIFASRENMSTVIIPYAGMGDALVDHIDINWNADYTITYFSVVPIMYSGFDIVEIPIYDAIHSIDNLDIKANILNTDENYAELDSLDFLTIRFDSIGPPQEGMLRDYIVETQGRYNVNGSMSKPFIMNNNSNNLNNAYKFQLHNNYPNPFNPKTNIRFEIGKASFVKLHVYNILGQLITTLINETREPGSYSVEFDGTNLPSGLYIYKIEAGSYTEAKKMLLIK